MLFQNFDSSRCCLCGDSGKLTGEHKIKASALRAEFGDAELYIGQRSNEHDRGRFVQSAQSKYLKFQAPICESCNTNRTQSADEEFDKFNNLAREILASGGDPICIFDLPQYSEGSEPYLNIFRYFAKLLSCQLAQTNAPRPIRLSEFAIGKSDEICVFLAIQKGQIHENLTNYIGELQYAAHDGLSVIGDKSTSLPKKFRSTLSIGPIEYIFYINLTEDEKSELINSYPEFTEFCRLQVERAQQSP